LNSRSAHRRALASIALAGLTVCAALVSHLLLFQSSATAHIFDTSTPTPTNSPVSAPANSPYLYFVLKQTNGFALARAHEGTNSQPTETPQIVAIFDDAFGQSTADSVISLQASPDGRFVAIDGTHSDGELLWIFNASNLTLSREPANVSGTFLHWLPNNSGLFIYRPILPLGPGAPLNTANWQPGLWIGNASTGTFTNVDVHVPSSLLVDAILSPDDSQLVYSTSRGLGLGCDLWSEDLHGLHLKHLLQLAGDDDAEDIAGMLDWSPDGLSIAYERLDDSPTPFLPAGLWIMDRQGGHQRFLAQADGGHGFALRWSPDSTKIAFVARTNPTVSMADQSIQSLQSAVDVVDVSSGRVWSVASPMSTGVQINASPAWSANSSQITFAAFNPLNPELGGKVRYWSAEVSSSNIHPSAVALSQPITHVIALG
jgi:WD40 repeat protein